MEKEKKYRIFITGGHATPAVACINELKARGYTNLVYIGQKKSLLFDKNTSSEYKLITEKVNIPFKNLIAGKYSLFSHWHSLIWILRLPVGFIQALFFQIVMRPRLILTFGSHVGVPVAFVGWLFRTPVISHEQTITVGRANKFIRRFAFRVCYSWQEIIYETDEKKKTKLNKELQTKKYLYTGNPIREEILDARSIKLPKIPFITSKRKTLFVTGGNQGAHSINELIFDNLDRLLEKYNIIHQTGSNTIYNDYEKAVALSKKYNTEEHEIYSPYPYLLTDQMSQSYKKADILISRGGANTTCEIIILKKKALIIPIPTTSGDEQFLQGKLLQDLGLSKVIRQSELTHVDLLSALEEILDLKIKDRDLVNLMSTVHKNAQKRIIDIVENKLKKLED